ncbi:FAD binding domain protein [Synechococcus sp. PCC 7335]|uniref:FAD-binding oxidoreductase n=1 Tax=Synechococcus sp. (strain ATCC 29403 / PCC 7335) TaxID=91464 RepID=UPI00017EBFAB|nr:FAD-binding oxidoreductase [Synechococcus sp. PCC 7335]EDX86163.1 FAD binding domain protein [Synechococcus sp. PCC 7335]
MVTPITSISALLGEDRCIPWETVDPRKQAQIMKAMAKPPNCLALPHTTQELAQVMALATEQNWRVLPVGQASKLGWGGFAKDIDIALSTVRLNRIVEHAVGDFTVTVEAGLKLSDLSEVLSKEGQFLAVDPAFLDQATIGGIVATADTGSLRQRYGGLRDMLIGVQFVRYDGKLAHAGGRVVKNVAGYDLMKLMTGGYGTLGILSEMTFRLYPAQPVSKSLVLTGTVDAIAQAAAKVRLSGLTPVAFDVTLEDLSNLASLGSERSDPNSAVALVVRFQGIAAGVEEQSEQLVEIANEHQLTTKYLKQAADAQYWQRAATWVRADTILCKVGMKPSAIAPLVEKLSGYSNVQSRLHGSSGLGWIQWQATAGDGKERIREIEWARSHCQKNGGFLSLLQAPAALKQSIDIWGYTGNAFQVMADIKQKFDPQRLLSPGRFIGGI